jgi:hypothetical protein
MLGIADVPQVEKILDSNIWVQIRAGSHHRSRFQISNFSSDSQQRPVSQEKGTLPIGIFFVGCGV